MDAAERDLFGRNLGRATGAHSGAALDAALVDMGWHQAALIVLVEHVNEWPEGGDLALSVGAIEWEGVGRGHGHLQGRRAEVRVSGRRSAGPSRRHRRTPARSSSKALGHPGSYEATRRWWR